MLKLFQKVLPQKHYNAVSENGVEVLIGNNLNFHLISMIATTIFVFQA